MSGIKDRKKYNIFGKNTMPLATGKHKY